VGWDYFCAAVAQAPQSGNSHSCRSRHHSRPRSSGRWRSRRHPATLALIRLPRVSLRADARKLDPLALARDDEYERKLVIRAASYIASVDTPENIAISSAASGNEIPLPQKAAVLEIEFIPRVVTPERLYRGSTMLTTTLSQVERVGGPVRTFPLDSRPSRPSGP